MELQGLLFGGAAPGLDPTLSAARRIPLGTGAFLDHLPGWVVGHDAVFDHLVATTQWTEGEREMYERVVAVPRLVAGLPDDGPGHPVLDQAVAALSARYARPVDRVSLALYRDGRDSVAYHGDRMGDAVADCIVAIVSLRGPRRLRVRPKGGHGPARSFDLGCGDLLVMGGTCQRDFEHGVPKVASAPPRMSVMFRSSG
ncbi:MAG: alpha-ketoglutarate-dependent dioxygenase AlkB [Myxococcota bacterium]